MKIERFETRGLREDCREDSETAKSIVFTARTQNKLSKMWKSLILATASAFQLYARLQKRRRPAFLEM